MQLQKAVLLLIFIIGVAQSYMDDSGPLLSDSIAPTGFQPPLLRIKQHPQSQIASKGSKIVFKCEYETDENASNSVKVSWLFNANLLSPNGQYSIERNRLVVLNFEPSFQSGQYRCMVNSSQLVVISEPANLTQASIDQFEPLAQKSDENIQLNLSEGNVAIIACKLPASTPPAQPIFYLNDQLIQTSMQSETGSRYKVFPSGNLQITNVKYSDSGVYKCQARNPVTNEIRTNPKKTNLKVYEPFGTKLPEIVYVPVDTNRVQMGSNLTLECVANGAPVPLVSWEKFGGILPEKRSFQIFGNLVLNNVQPEDKGTYVCRAENGPGQATFKTAMIDVFEAPVVETNALVMTQWAKTGDSIDLKCPIRSRPRADVQWFFQGRQIVSSNRDKAVLTVRNFVPSLASGVYQCYAQNEYGFAQANIQLFSSET
jgi:hypothetical protein